MECGGFVLLIIAVVWQWCCILGSDADKVDHCPSLVTRSGQYVAVHNHTCYMFVDVEKTWTEARDFCFRLGGELVIIKNRQTMNFIRSMLDSPRLGWNNNGVWNGANNLRKKGWEWTTGEHVTYSYWADGEPSKTFGWLSFENCACMRRGDGWRWHDYHCDMSPFDYKFICQFPVINPNQPGKTQYHASQRIPVTTRDETVAIIGLAVGGFLLLVILLTVFFFLYRKRKQQIEDELQVRFENENYSNNSPTELRVVRPTSHIYLDPMEVSQIYEDINKDTNHGVNNLQLGMQESTPLNYTGATSEGFGAVCDGYVTPTVGDGYMTPSEASGATSGYCSNSSSTERKETDYVEMNGATGGRATNMYVTAKKMNEPLPPKPINTEMHIYTNQMEQVVDNNAHQPLLKQNGSTPPH